MIEYCPLPPMSTLHPPIWWMRPGLPAMFQAHRSYALMYHCECIQNLKTGKQDEFIAGNEHQVDMPNLTSLCNRWRWLFNEEDIWHRLVPVCMYCLSIKTSNCNRLTLVPTMSCYVIHVASYGDRRQVWHCNVDIGFMGVQICGEQFSLAGKFLLLM